MSTEMKRVDPFSMPQDAAGKVLSHIDNPLEHSSITLEHDLHDDYDLLSQPINSALHQESKKNESR